MLDALQALSMMLVVLALVPALAHALELPGKMRLAKNVYFAVQPIYYPGFTIAGMSEPIAIVATGGLLVLTPRASTAFWLTLGALLGMIGMHAIYWLFTHPVNSFWLRGEKLGSAGTGFFSLGPSSDAADWRRLRDRWEYSHVARAALGFVSLVALVIGKD